MKFFLTSDDYHINNFFESTNILYFQRLIVPSFLKRFKKKFQDKSIKKILEIIYKKFTPLFVYKEYFLYEEDNLPYYKLKPKLDQAQFIFFSDYQKFQELIEEQGMELLDFDIRFIKYMFDNEAIAFCSVIENHLAHMTWVALDEKSMEKIERLPIKIDWENEACWGMAQTSSSYKRLGLYSCVHAQIAMYLKSKGIQKNKFSINKNNMPSNQAMSIFQSKVYADAYSVKFLFWEFCFIINRIFKEE